MALSALPCLVRPFPGPPPLLSVSCLDSVTSSNGCFRGQLPWAPPRLLLEGHLHGSVCLWFHVAVRAGSRPPHWSRGPLRRECPNPASLVLCAGGLSEQGCPRHQLRSPRGGRAQSGWARLGRPARPGGLLVGLPGRSRPPPGAQRRRSQQLSLRSRIPEPQKRRPSVRPAPPGLLRDPRPAPLSSPSAIRWPQSLPSHPPSQPSLPRPALGLTFSPRLLLTRFLLGPPGPC